MENYKNKNKNSKVKELKYCIKNHRSLQTIRVNNHYQATKNQKLLFSFIDNNMQ